MRLAGRRVDEWWGAAGWWVCGRLVGRDLGGRLVGVRLVGGARLGRWVVEARLVGCRGLVAVGSVAGRGCAGGGGGGLGVVVAEPAWLVGAVPVVGPRGVERRGGGGGERGW
ncbi:hypothetical protein GCM10010109_33090 [Actinoplanes campanulatus]|nr:hypothetical protein GCM10010109_33090 [Actinoplanes campanulatus]GID41647.1 hypothetical protein Aca09nite_81530 [Actinoplanes campanulatus]